MVVDLQTSSSFKVLTLQEKDLWNRYLHEACESDFYHTWEYHALDKQGQAFMFIYEREDLFIGVPLIKRPIPGTGYYDCTSVYGYVGPFSNKDLLAIQDSIKQDFHLVFRDYLQSQKIVTVFAVLHPLFKQQGLLAGGFTVQDNASCELKPVGKTIAIDLKQSLDEQRLQYRRPIRMKINQLRKKGFTVKVAESEKELHEFIDLYVENMAKVNASEKYFFEQAYFENFMLSTSFSPRLLVAYYEDRMVAGAMIGMTKQVVQLHLAGTRNEFLRESPMKLIFDEASLIGRANNMQYLHLGSGVGGAEDSLFHFKRGFSENVFDFVTWRYIVDHSVYVDLVEEKINGKTAPDVDLFPLYRFV
ncbi:GNAT family N-acetyltransferase [Olivibacter sp. XZL3]|uniref:GNAT family N-acetyltransferase n=1 Tax=Olivibacter sp. XZL3 TaxID=1735116 RepID=UPI001065AB11|nr:GNAT family N-acetyltransferase [Olivibacter sp. XZL3]